MKAGKRVAMEVGGAYSAGSAVAVGYTSEETGIPCMMLENCCYGRDELMVRNMVEQGVFGEIVHCQGGISSRSAARDFLWPGKPSLPSGQL
ncbi:MAG: hypothetical protein ACLR23_08440 [Clostridia bacterium]